MKKIAFAITLVAGIVFAGASAEAAVRVSGYYRSNGTYVGSYYRSSPNSYRYDNYSTYGNYNPYSGKTGTKRYYSWY